MPLPRGARRCSPLAAGLVCAALVGCGTSGDPPGKVVGPSASPALPGLTFGPSSAAPSASVAAQSPDDEPDELLDPNGPTLVATAMETYVFRRPSFASPKIGYLRAGAVVLRAQEPASTEGCAGGFFRIAPRGYVCAGKGAAIDPSSPFLEAQVRGPLRGEAYPYKYVISRSPAPHLYVRLPTLEDQRRVEGRPAEGPALSPFARAEMRWLGPADPITDFLRNGRDLPKPFGAEERVRFPVHRGRAKAKSAFGLMATFEWTGRRFGLTTELDLIPIDRTRVVRPSRMHGVRLDAPVAPAFVMHGGARLYERVSPGKFRPLAAVEHRSGWALTGQGDGVTLADAQRGQASSGYLETTSGAWLPAQGLRVGTLTTDSWGYAKKGKKWIDVSIERQILVAYEGTRPVYATLVSTGRGGLGDPRTTSATVQGVFFVQSKHLATTMDGTGGATSRDLHDVPYVQYFHNNYALHGVYWHDDFGKTMSSGCVNLAPADAAWLFEWTEPSVPRGFHGVQNPNGGTLIYVHP